MKRAHMFKRIRIIGNDVREIYKKTMNDGKIEQFLNEWPLEPVYIDVAQSW